MTINFVLNVKCLKYDATVPFSVVSAYKLSPCKENEFRNELFSRKRKNISNLSLVVFILNHPNAFVYLSSGTFCCKAFSIIIVYSLYHNLEDGS